MQIALSGSFDTEKCSVHFAMDNTFKLDRFQHFDFMTPHYKNTLKAHKKQELLFQLNFIFLVSYTKYNCLIM